jgi:hypothetical protein
MSTYHEMGENQSIRRLSLAEGFARAGECRPSQTERGQYREDNELGLHLHESTAA